MVIRSLACLDVKRDLYWGDTISSPACAAVCVCVCGRGAGRGGDGAWHKLRQAGIFSVGEILPFMINLPLFLNDVLIKAKTVLLS